MSELDDLVKELRGLNNNLGRLIETLAPKPKKTRASSIETGPTWDAYARAFKEVHGQDPVRNATVNTMLRQFVKKIGMKEGPAVASFYVRHNNRWYAQKMHPVQLLNSDAEKIRTIWANEIKRKQWEEKKQKREEEERIHYRPGRAKEIAEQLGLKIKGVPTTPARTADK